MQFEDLGFCGKGEGPDFIRANSFEVGGSFPFNTSGGQLSVGQAGAAGGHLGIVEAHPPAYRTDARRARRRRPARPGLGLRHDQLRSRRLQRRRGAGRSLIFMSIAGTHGVSETAASGRNAKIRCCARGCRRCRRRRAAASRSGLTAAAARGRFELQVCQDCGAVQYPPREVCRACLSHRLVWRAQDGARRTAHRYRVARAQELFFRERLPWRIGNGSPRRRRQRGRLHPRQSSARAVPGARRSCARPRGPGGAGRGSGARERLTWPTIQSCAR